MMREKIIFNQENEDKLHDLDSDLTHKFPSRNLEKIDKEEITNLTQAIKTNSYAYSLKNFLYYISEGTANLLANSKHPVLKQWGDKCQQFYKTDPLNQFVDPLSGMAVVKRGGYNNIYSIPVFIGQGAWELIENNWVPVPGSYSDNYPWSYTIDNFNKIVYGGSSHCKAVNPPSLCDYPMDLISPMHIAALLGDKVLMQMLLDKGASFDDDHNKSRVMPVEFPVLFEKMDILDFMLKKGLAKNKILKAAAKIGSFSFIKKLLDMNFPITDDVLESALN